MKCLVFTSGLIQRLLCLRRWAASLRQGREARAHCLCAGDCWVECSLGAQDGLTQVAPRTPSRTSYRHHLCGALCSHPGWSLQPRLSLREGCHCNRSKITRFSWLTEFLSSSHTVSLDSGMESTSCSLYPDCTLQIATNNDREGS